MLFNLLIFIFILFFNFHTKRVSDTPAPAAVDSSTTEDANYDVLLKIDEPFVLQPGRNQVQVTETVSLEF